MNDNRGDMIAMFGGLTMDQWMAKQREEAARLAAAASAEFFAKGDPVPDVEFPWPDCPICQTDLTLDDTDWWCDTCCIMWEQSGRVWRVDVELRAERGLS